MAEEMSDESTLHKPAPKAFTWDNARDLAIIVRDGLLMIVRGFEKYFDIGKKSENNNSQQS